MRSPAMGRYGENASLVAQSRDFPVIGVLALLLALAPAMAHGETVSEGTSSRQAMREAIDAIPLAEMNEEVRARLQGVLDRPSIYRRLPSQRIDCDPDLHVFLVRHPEVVVNIWELMGVANVSMERIARYTLRTSDGAGTTGTVELAYGTSTLHVMYGEGSYEGPLLARPVTGRLVLLLRSDYSLGADGRPKVTDHLDAFLKIENSGADLLARTLQPWLVPTADYNFIESTRFVEKMSRAAEMNGGGMETLTERLDKVDPAARRQLSSLTAAVGQKGLARLRAAEQQLAEQHQLAEERLAAQRLADQRTASPNLDDLPEPPVGIQQPFQALNPLPRSGPSPGERRPSFRR